MTIRPVEFKAACQFIAALHRHHKPPRGHRWSLSAWEGDRMVGVVVVGRPVGRHQDDGATLEVTRLCTDGTRNACSFLLGAVKRIARMMGYARLISYTLEHEPGSSWRACEMKHAGLTDGGAWGGEYGDGGRLPGMEQIRSNTHPIGRKQRWEIAL